MPRILRLQLTTPLGSSTIERVSRRVALRENTRSGSSAGVRSMRTFGSAISYSLATVSTTSFIATSSASASALGMTTVTWASAAMTLFCAPPNGASMRRSKPWASMVLSARASRMIALMRSRWMSNSQWPPVSPWTVSVRATRSGSSGASHSAGMSITAETSPPQPARISSSVIQLKSIIRVPRQQRRVEVGPADLALLLHRGEHGLERRVRDVGGVEQSEDVGDADAVVGAERRAVGGDVVAVAQQVEPLGQEVELDVVVLGAHHVQVAVQDERRRVLVARAAGLAHQHAPAGRPGGTRARGPWRTAPPSR